MSKDVLNGGPIDLRLNHAGRATHIFIVVIGTSAACLGIPVLAAVTVLLFSMFHYMHRHVIEQKTNIDLLQFEQVAWLGTDDMGCHQFSVCVDGSALRRPLLISLELNCDGFHHETTRTLIVPPAHRADITFVTRMPEVGQWRLKELRVRWTLFGGFFKVERQYPISESVVIWPQYYPGRLRVPAIQGQSNGRTESTRSSRLKGPHGDVRELGEYMRGDSARSIAWKASARHHRLLVRRRDELYENSTVILMNIGPKMRDGDIGQRHLDRAISLAYTLAKTHENDPVGLILFDHRVITQVPPKMNRSERHTIARALTQIPHLCEQDLTEISNEEVYALVSQFLVDRVPESICPPSDPRDLDELNRVLGAQMEAERLRTAMTLYESSLDDSTLKGPRAYAPLDITARGFCQRHGLRLPYRLSGPDLNSRDGLMQSVQQAILMQPTSVLLVDHPDTFDHDGAWLKSKMMLRRRSIEGIVYTVG